MGDPDLATGRVVSVRATSRNTQDTGPRRLERGRLSLVIVIEGLPVGELPAGARLRLGATAVVQLVASVGTEGESSVSPRDREAGGLLEASALALASAEVLEPGDVARGDDVALDSVMLPVTEILDLHTFQPADTQQVVRSYLAEAQRAGLDEVRIVHGRGRGVQRALVRRVLGGAPEVAEFADAPPTRGGWGATLIRLRRAEDSPST